MLIEVRTKVAWVIDGKIRKKTETYILDRETFSLAEQEVISLLNTYKDEGTVEYYEIQVMRISSITEICNQYQGDISFIATLRDIVLQDDGTEKQLKYKVLLWADNISQAMANTRELASQGYDMQIDSLKEVNYTYLNSQGE